MPDFLNLKKQNLKYLDALVYAAIKWHDNNKNGYAHPSYEKIMKRTGLGRTFVSSSIKRLEKGSFFSVEHSTCEGMCNRYYFEKTGRFERIPYSVFDATDLTAYQKAMLLCLRQFFNHGRLQCTFDIKTLALYLGLSYSQVSKPLNALIAKGYIEERANHFKRRHKANSRMVLTDKIDWMYDYCKPSEQSYSLDGLHEYPEPIENASSFKFMLG